jgi:Flp pilus assembly protein TadG
MWFKQACGVAARAGRKRRALRGEEGAELVEFALCSWLLFMFIFGVVELCLVLFSFNTAAEAARDTARWLSVQGASAIASSASVNSTAITNHVQAIPGAAQMTQTVNWCQVSGSTTTCSTTPNSNNAAAGDLVQVQVQYVFANVPFISNGALTATSTSQMVIWQ